MVVPSRLIRLRNPICKYYFQHEYLNDILFACILMAHINILYYEEAKESILKSQAL